MNNIKYCYEWTRSRSTLLSVKRLNMLHATKQKHAGTGGMGQACKMCNKTTKTMNKIIKRTSNKREKKLIDFVNECQNVHVVKMNDSVYIVRKF